MREEIEGKFVGLERVIVDTRYGQLLLVYALYLCLLCVSRVSSESMQAMREEIEGKFVGLERVIVDTRYGQLLLVCIHYVFVFCFTDDNMLMNC